MSTTLTMYRGDTRRFTLTIKRNGAAEDLTGLTGTGLSFTTKGAAVISKTIGSGIVLTDAAAGIATLTLLPADTSALTNGATLSFDVQLITLGGDVETIATGILQVLKDVTP